MLKTIIMALLLLMGTATQVYAATSKFISQLVPEDLQAGKQYTIAVQFKNTSRNSWKNPRLIAKKSADARNWGISSSGIQLKDVVSPGQNATFQFDIQAPRTPGTYPMQWQLVDDNQQSLGSNSPRLKVKVAKSDIYRDAEFVHQTMPGLKQLGAYYSIMHKDSVYPVTLTFKNTGTTTWKPGKVSLATKNPEKNMRWSLSQVEMKGEEVKPGAIKSFSFKIITPPQPGIYSFQWQLYEEGRGWIGEASEDVAITVR